jgi:hypothetical protein
MNELSPTFGQNLRSIVFSSESTTRLKGASAKFPSENVKENIQSDLEALHARVRKQFGYKRKDIEFDLSEPEVGRLRTPDFEYRLRATIGDERNAEVTWVREFDLLNRSAPLSDRRTLDLLGDELDTITLTFSTPLDIADVIDRIEDVEPPDVDLEYDLQCRWCELSLKGVPAVLRLEGSELKLRRQAGRQIQVDEMLAMIEPRRFGLA